jgi:transcriptional regulator with XRE-family HTH domain
MNTKPLLRTVGQRVRELRRAQGLNRQQVADLAGVHMTTVRSLERQQPAGTSLHTLAGLSRALGVPIGVLVGEQPMPSGGVPPIEWRRVRAEVDSLREAA